MEAKILKTEAEYQAALVYVEQLMDAEPGSPEEEELELFSLSIQQYEQEHYPIPAVDPVDAERFRNDQLGLTCKDHPAFGLWRGRDIDALAYEQALRSEWVGG